MLREFLSTNRAAIIERTRSKVEVRLAPRATEAELERGIPSFLQQLIDALEGPRAASPAIVAGAVLHGGDLLKQGFTIAQVVHDYGGLCQAVTELATETNAPITADEFRTFNGCLDDAIAQAVTEYSRQREQSLTDAGRERLGGLAHELRNALSSAMIAFDILRGGSVGVGGSTAGVIDRSLRRLSTLIDSSLAEVRLSSGIRAPERVSMREFVEEVEVGAAMEANARELTLAVTRVEPGVDVEVDRQFLAAAVANLLSNAFKFSRPHGHIGLKTSSTTNRVLIEVEDECGGLPSGDAEGLFLPFEQRSSDRKGLGLGLSIARRSVETDGGKLSARDLPGVGCVFTIELPRLAPAP
jgi:signal transduction histidine kinase